MKIIKEGNKKVMTMKVTCPFCQAELEVEAKDFIRPEGGGLVYLICPCCNGRMSMGYTSLPLEIVNGFFR